MLKHDPPVFRPSAKKTVFPNTRSVLLVFKTTKSINFTSLKICILSPFHAGLHGESTVEDVISPLTVIMTSVTAKCIEFSYILITLD